MMSAMPRFTLGPVESGEVSRGQVSLKHVSIRLSAFEIEGIANKPRNAAPRVFTTHMLSRQAACPCAHREVWQNISGVYGENT